MRKFIGHPDLKIKMFSGNGNKTFPDFICTYGLLGIYGCYAPNVTSNNNTLTSVKSKEGQCPYNVQIKALLAPMKHSSLVLLSLRK